MGSVMQFAHIWTYRTVIANAQYNKEVSLSGNFDCRKLCCKSHNFL